MTVSSYFKKFLLQDDRLQEATVFLLLVFCVAVQILRRLVSSLGSASLHQPGEGDPILYQHLFWFFDVLLDAFLVFTAFAGFVRFKAQGNVEPEFSNVYKPEEAAFKLFQSK